MKNRLVLSLMFTCLLAGCAPAAGTATVISGPDATATRNPPPIPSPIPLATRRPTITIEPTSTPAASLTPITMAPSSEAQRITFTTEDEVELVGYFYPTWKPNAPVLVLMHQRYGTQRMWFDEKSSLVQWLQNWPTADGAEPTPSSQGMLPVLIPELGYNVFTVDFRGHGESAGSLPADPQTYLIDARAAYKAARSLPGVHPRQVLGFGTSIGADAVVDACENLCAGAFSISPGSWLNVDYAQAARQMLDAGKPIRCMYAINDHPSPATCESVPRSHLYQVFAYAGSKHGMTFLVPRKMEMDFGPNLINFILQATEK